MRYSENTFEEILTLIKKYYQELIRIKDKLLISDPLPSPASLAIIEEFEQKHHIQFPKDYRRLITEVSDGLGFWNFSQILREGKYYNLYDSSHICSKPFLPSFLELNPKSKYYRPDALDWENPDGVLFVNNHGCTIWDVLIISGPERGHLWRYDECDTGLTMFPLKGVIEDKQRCTMLDLAMQTIITGLGERYWDFCPYCGTINSLFVNQCKKCCFLINTQKIEIQSYHKPWNMGFISGTSEKWSGYDLDYWLSKIMKKESLSSEQAAKREDLYKFLTSQQEEELRIMNARAISVRNQSNHVITIDKEGIKYPGQTYLDEMKKIRSSLRPQIKETYFLIFNGETPQESKLPG